MPPGALGLKRQASYNTRHLMRKERPRIRPLVEGDSLQLLVFLASVYPQVRDGSRTSVYEYYQWKYFDLTGRRTGAPSGFVAEVDASIVGFIGCLPFFRRRARGLSSAAWIADWHLQEQFRGLGIGRELLVKAIDEVPTLACVGGTEDACRLFRETGFSKTQCGFAFLHVLRPIRFEWPKRRGFRKVISLYRALGHAATGIRFNHRLINESGNMELARVSSVENLEPMLQLDRRWGGIRDAGYLSWLLRSPVANVTLYRVLNQGIPFGYSMVQKDVDRLGRCRGRILDLFLEHTTEQAAIVAVQLIVRALSKEFDLDYIDTVLPSSQTKTMRAAGFQQRKSVDLWLRDASKPDECSDWTVTLLDKDDAFRGTSVVP